MLQREHVADLLYKQQQKRYHTIEESAPAAARAHSSRKEETIRKAKLSGKYT